MASRPGGAGYPSRQGLNARSGGTGDVAIQIDPRFDFDSEVEGLSAHVRKIKQMSMAIEDERKQQGEIINSLEDVLDRTKVALSRTMRRMNIAYTQAQSWHVLALVVFSVVLLTSVYMVSKILRIGHRLVGG